MEKGIQVLQYAVTLAALILGTGMDLRTRKIRGWLPVIHLLSAAVIHLLQIWMMWQGESSEGGAQMTEMVAGLMPGVVCLFLSFVTGQAFGYGDSLLILGCGFSLGLTPCLRILMTALAGSGLWGIIQIVRKKADRKTEIPFVPFLLAGMLIFLLQNH